MVHTHPLEKNDVVEMEIEAINQFQLLLKNHTINCLFLRSAT